MIRDYRGREDGNEDEIVEQDKADIDVCEALLVYYDRPSVGTSMEVLYAWERGKAVFVVNPQRLALSPWLRYHSHAVTPDLDIACAALRLLLHL